MPTFHIITIGHLTRNMYWGEPNDTPSTPASPPAPRCGASMASF